MSLSSGQLLHPLGFAGMTSMLLDYMLVCVSAVSGMQRVTREHLAVALTLDIPVAVVITKIDAVDAGQVGAVQGQVCGLITAADRALRVRLGAEISGEVCQSSSVCGCRRNSCSFNKEC